METQISCDLHDYIEIACLYHYQVRLHLRDNSFVEGIAHSTATRDNKIEVVQLETDDLLVEVILHELSRMEVLTPNAKFHKVEFV